MPEEDVGGGLRGRVELKRRERATREDWRDRVREEEVGEGGDWGREEERTAG